MTGSLAFLVGFPQCPPERYIGIEFVEIQALLRIQMDITQRQNHENVCQLIESLYAQE
jgi:hypothetical protein